MLLAALAGLLSNKINEFVASNFFKILFISFVFLISEVKSLKIIKELDSFFSLINDAKLIFLVPPSLDDLKQRLIKRNLDSSEAIENRLSEAKKEISKSEMYDYLVLNDDFDRAFEDLSQILFEGISPVDFNSRASKDLIKRLVE